MIAVGNVVWRWILDGKGKGMNFGNKIRKNDDATKQ